MRPLKYRSFAPIPAVPLHSSLTSLRHLICEFIRFSFQTLVILHISLRKFLNRSASVLSNMYGFMNPKPKIGSCRVVAKHDNVAQHHRSHSKNLKPYLWQRRPRTTANSVPRHINQLFLEMRRQTNPHICRDRIYSPPLGVPHRALDPLPKQLCSAEAGNPPSRPHFGSTNGMFHHPLYQLSKLLEQIRHPSTSCNFWSYPVSTYVH